MIFKMDSIAKLTLRSPFFKLIFNFLFTRSTALFLLYVLSHCYLKHMIKVKRKYKNNKLFFISNEITIFTKPPPYSNSLSRISKDSRSPCLIISFVFLNFLNKYLPTSCLLHPHNLHLGMERVEKIRDSLNAAI